MPRDDERILNPLLIGIALLVVLAGVGAALWLALGEETAPPDKEIIKIVRPEAETTSPSSPETSTESSKPSPTEPSSSPLEVSPARIWGSAVRSEDGSPIGEIEVLAARSRDEEPIRRRTRPDGSFRFDDVPEGKWWIVADASGTAEVHSKEYYGFAEITPGAKIDNIVVKTAQPATIGGKVETFIGKPVSAARVQVFAGWNKKGQAVSSSPWGGTKDLRDALALESLAETVTDESGNFSIGGLEEGTYDLVANGTGFARQVVLGAPTGSAGISFRLEPEVRIEGTVTLSTDRKPLEGAEVTVRFDAPGFPQFSGSVLTDASGHYRITGLPRKAKLVVQAVSGEIESAPFSRTFVGQPGPQTRDLVVIPDRRIHGRVLNSHTKAAIPDVEVWVENRLGTVKAASTGADGHFEIQTGIASHKIQFRKPGEYRDSEWLEVEFRDLERDHELPPIELVEGLSLEGKVTDSKTKFPLPGALVRAIPVDSKVLDLKSLPTAVTDGAGRFLLEGVPRGSHYLSGEHLGYAPGYARPPESAETGPGRIPITVEPPGPLEGFEIVLSRIPTVTVSGTVVDAKKQPVVGATVGLTPPVSEDKTPAREVAVDAEGKFLIGEVPIGVYSLSVQHPDYWPSGLESIALQEGKNLEGIGIALEPKEGLTVTGKVVDPDGQPLENVSIGAFYGRKETLYAARILAGNATLNLPQIPEKAMKEPTATTAWTKTKADGTYTLEGLRSGAYTVAAGDVYASEYRYDVAAGSTGVDFQLTWGGGIAGTVYQIDGQTPCTNFRIHLKVVSVDPILRAGLEGREEFRNGQAFNAPDGSFEISGLPNGYYTLTAVAEGVGEANVFGIAVKNGEYPPDFMLVLNGGGGIKGQVVASIADAPGTQRGVANATVRLGEVTKQTDASGAFEFRGLAEDDYALLVEHHDYASVFKSNIRVQSGQSTDIGAVSLTEGGAIEGRVFYKDGVGAAGFIVQIDGDQTMDWGQDFGFNLARADMDGYFRIPNVSAGSYRLTVRRPSAVAGRMLSEYGRPILTRSLQVQGQGVTNVQLIVDDGARVSGRVVVAGRPLVHSTLVLYPRYGTDLQELIAITDAEGNYSFDGVPPGVYEVFASEYSDDPKRASLTVPNAPEHQQDFTF